MLAQEDEALMSTLRLCDAGEPMVTGIVDRDVTVAVDDEAMPIRKIRVTHAVLGP